MDATMVERWSVWEPENELIISRLTGNVTVEDVAEWQATLDAALAEVANGGGFKLLVDITGYELQDMATHKAFRTVIPTLLAAYGMRPAVLDLFPEAEITVTTTRGIVCRAYANVHHDVEKMAEYERTLGRANQRFFTNVDEARAWLLALDPAHWNR